MRLLVDGKRTRTSTGTSGIWTMTKRRGWKRSGRSKSKRQKPWPPHCECTPSSAAPQNSRRDICRGFATGAKPGTAAGAAGPATGSNAVAVPPPTASTSEREAEKEEKKRRKAGRKEEKRAKKEEKTRRRAAREDEGRRPRGRSRSRSPPRRPRDHDGRPPTRQRSRTPVRPRREAGPYDDVARERERERERRRWGDNARREQPGARWGRD